MKTPSQKNKPLQMLILIASACASLLLPTGCGTQDEVSSELAKTQLTIYTTIAPHYYACRQLLGEHDQLINTCPVEQDAANYTPERQVLKELIKSDLIIINGASFEQWIPHVTLPDSKVLDASLNFKKDWLNYQAKRHSHGGADDHSHKGVNGHTWLAPHYFKKQCQAIYERLQTILSKEEQQRRSLTDNHNRLQEQLAALDAKGQALFAPLKSITLAATHPTYDYLAQQYGFKVFNITLDPEAENLDQKAQQEIERLKKQQAETGISYLLWESQPNEKMAEAITDLGIKNILFAPLESMDHQDYIAGMEANFTRMKKMTRDQHNAK
jgi:zinc transport system substrate-binding protein